MKTVMMTRGVATALPCGQPAVPGASSGVRARGEFAGLLQQVAPEGSPGARSRAPGHLQDPTQVGPPGLALGRRLREAGPATGTGEGGERREQLAVLLGASAGNGDAASQPSAPAGHEGAEGAPAVSDTASTGCEESLTALAAAQAATAGPGAPGEGEEAGEGDPGQAPQPAAEPVLLVGCGADARDAATATAIDGLPAMAIVPATAAGSAPAPEAISAPPAAAQPDAVLPGEPVLVSIEAATVNTAGLPSREACAGSPQPDLQSHAQAGAEAGAGVDQADPRAAVAANPVPTGGESARPPQQGQPPQEAPQAAPGAVEGSEQDQDTSGKAPYPSAPEQAGPVARAARPTGLQSAAQAGAGAAAPPPVGQERPEGASPAPMAAQAAGGPQQAEAPAESDPPADQRGQEPETGSDGRRVDIRELIDIESRRARGPRSQEGSAANSDPAGKGLAVAAGTPAGLHAAMHTPVAAAAQAAQPAADPQALLDQLVQRFAVMVRGGLAEMKMVLKPDMLGKLAISIQVEDDLVTARFTAESHRVKHLLEAGLPQLKAALEAGGIKLDRAEVEVSPAVSQGAAGDTSRQHQSQAQAGAPRTGRSPAGWQQETMAAAQSAAVPRSPSLGWSGQIDFVV